MCGLVGFIGPAISKNDDIFADLLFLDTVRGKDSTGVTCVAVDGSTTSFKALGLPDNLFQDKDFRKALLRQNNIVMGHNRFATKGNVNEANAHPFTHGRITGMHNGTLVGDWRLDNYQDFDTDSEAIMYNIAKDGIEETYKKIEGAAALSYYDDEEQTLNLITNGRRPLYLATLKDRPGMFYASEQWMLNAAITRNEIAVNMYYRPNPHFLFSYKWEDQRVKSWSRELSPFVHGEYSKNHSRHVYQNGSGQGNHGVNQAASIRELELKRKVDLAKATADKTEEKKAKKEIEGAKGNESVTVNASSDEATALLEASRDAIDNVIPFDIDDGLEGWGVNSRLYKLHDGTLVSKQQLENQYPHCCFCHSELDFDVDEVVVYDEENAGCQECNRQSAIFQIPFHTLH